MLWKSYHHLSTRKPATASVKCKQDVGEAENCVVAGGVMVASCGRCMTNDVGNLPDPRGKPRYTWPWFVLAAVLLAIALAVLWMSHEIERIRRIRDLNAPVPRTDPGATSAIPSARVADWRL
jgi:hypothetical protein